MAGIGFELRRNLAKESLTDLLRAYLAAGIIGSGPWVISIGSMLLIGLLSRELRVGDPALVTPFLATITHLMATSLVFSGLVQHVFTRFVADRVYEAREDVIAPNLAGVLLLTTVAGGALSAVIAFVAFEGNAALRCFLVVAFVLLCDVWVLGVFLSGMKAYRRILVVFAVGYGVTSMAALALASFGLVGYLAGFCVGQALMLFSMLLEVLRQYPSERLLAWEFLDRRKVHGELVLTGLLFNVAVWADKVVFWQNSLTSESVLGPIRYSVVYDVPIFVAYLALIPGMAVLFVRIEVDFAEAYAAYFRAVCEVGRLAEVRALRGRLVRAARAAVYDTLLVQGMAAAILFVTAGGVLRLFGLPPFYLHLFRVDVVAVSLQVVLLATFTILFYLDYRRLVLALSALFAVANLGLSLLTIELGPRFFGLGFAGATGLTSLVSFAVLSRKLDRLDYETFMR